MSELSVEEMVLKLAEALEQCAHRSAEWREQVEYFRVSRDKNGEALDAARAQVVALHAALTTEQQAREHDAVAADNALAAKDAQIDIWRSVSERADRLLAERQADRDNWHSRAHELATECERRAGEIGEKDAQIAQLREWLKLGREVT